MSPTSKREYLRAIRSRYRKAGKEEKGRILDEFCAVCGYQRKYAIRLVNRPEGSPGPAEGRVAEKKRGPKPRYGPQVLEVVKRIWLAAVLSLSKGVDQICSKRLEMAIPFWLPHYEREYGELPDEIWEKVLDLSPATIDRLLRPIRVPHRPKRLWGTKPGTLLRNQIPIRTSNWDITQPGYLEADAVAHCGNSMAGDFIWSLTFTDIYSGWTENRATWNRGAHGVLTQVKEMESSLVFPLLGFDCDNGAEFLNHHLLQYFTKRKLPVSFTRGRPYHINDNAHVEQKHWTHVRQLLGYDRFDNPNLVEPINSLYANEWSLFQNFFCPTLKLESKERINSKYRRRYRTPQTPCQRLLECPDVSPKAKQHLRDTFASLDPFALKEAIERKLKMIFNLHWGTHDESAILLGHVHPQPTHSFGSFFP